MTDASNQNSPFSDNRRGKDMEQQLKNLKPKFDSKIVTDVLRERIKLVQNPFPIDIFPKKVQDIILATNENLNFPIDFMGASMLYTIAVSIGNTYCVKMPGGWKQNAILYIALVANPGINKSHPLSFAIKPLQKKDNDNFQVYKELKKEYTTISNTPKKERNGKDIPEKPIQKQMIVSDFTPEALMEIHSNNLRGLGVYSDELASWFNNFNRYNNGSEEQFWLSTWSGKQLTVNRKTSDSIIIANPCISVCGTIQPGVLEELSKKRTENGFMDRILFSVLTDLKKECWSEIDINPKFELDWERIIEKILDIDLNTNDRGQVLARELSFTPEAKQKLMEWQRKHTGKINSTNDIKAKGVYIKIETYIGRFALCLQLLSYACNESGKDSISIESINGAIKLTDYFIHSAFQVHEIISNPDPLEKLPKEQLELYTNLPESFQTQIGVDMAKEYNIPERTFKRLLKNKDLFEKIRHGEYEKIA